ncbi:MAG TPA: hypothetical protein VGC41_24440 [Kofleriaceae bacterium]
MKKTDKTIRTHEQRRPIVHDWEPLFAQMQNVIEWSLDLAARLADDYDDDLDAIERVRTYVRGWLSGRQIDIDLNDLLTTLGILFAAIEIDRGIDSSALLAPLRRYPGSTLHLPGATRNEWPTVVIRPNGRRRNSCFGSQLFAA